MRGIYADYDYYVGEYLLGSEPVIPEEDWLRWEKQARSEIDCRTFNRLKANNSLLTDGVKDCVCELAELLYQAHSVSEQAMQQGTSGLLTSYSNDGESASFDTSQSAYTESGKKKKTIEIIRRYLENTGLLCAVVRRCDE